jgi:hypothetical protein
MTREKKELLKQLQAIDEAERLDYSIGDVGPGFWEVFEEQRRPIYERLNELMHGRLNDYFQACVI